MNKIIVCLCIIFISLSHYFILFKEYKKEIPNISKPKYSKVSIQFIKEQLAVKKKTKRIEKVQKTKELTKIKKKIFKKPITKTAKKVFVKKTIKKVEKTPPKKEIVKKIKISKKEFVEKTQVEKKEIKKHTSETQSLLKTKNFKKNYISELRAAIDKNKNYPLIAKRLKQEGRVLLSFRVLKNGEFINMKIISSSGLKRLDKAALKALFITKSFKKFATEIKEQYLDFTLPLEFKIR
ncbi:MAG: energy transducer TonB [Campylobacteraceae bacterium]|nr:energy transducer TonB [Campylobacteraceae bacterium]